MGWKRNALVLVLLAAAVAGPLSSPAAAHDKIEIGPYVVKWGWIVEPAAVDVLNAPEITITVKSTSAPVSGALPGFKAALYSGTLKRDVVLVESAEQPGLYLGDWFIPSRSGIYNIEFSGDINGTAFPPNTRGDMDQVQPKSAACFPACSADQAGKDAQARKAAAEAWAQANETAEQARILTIFAYGALGLGGAAIALAAYNAVIGRQSLAIARQKEQRAKGESAAASLLKESEPEKPEAEGPGKS